MNERQLLQELNAKLKNDKLLFYCLTMKICNTNHWLRKWLRYDEENLTFRTFSWVGYSSSFASSSLHKLCNKNRRIVKAWKHFEWSSTTTRILDIRNLEQKHRVGSEWQERQIGSKNEHYLKCILRISNIFCTNWICVILFFHTDLDKFGLSAETK